jgi:hypothetical protein
MILCWLLPANQDVAAMPFVVVGLGLLVSACIGAGRVVGGGLATLLIYSHRCDISGYLQTVAWGRGRLEGRGSTDALLR